jgi:hypothetical protein
MKTEDMTVEEMAMAMGLVPRMHRVWKLGRVWSDSDGDVVFQSETTRRWLSYPDGSNYNDEQAHDSEHAALTRLYRRRFPEPTTPPTPAPIVEPAPVQPPAMTPAEALSFIEAFSPCAHTSYTKVGFGHYVRCEDCEAVVPSERLPDARKRAEDFNTATDVLHRLITGKQATEPAPVQQGGNVALVMRALEAWKRVPKIAADVDDATARAFGEMLAEAYVADAKGGA